MIGDNYSTLKTTIQQINNNNNKMTTFTTNNTVKEIMEEAKEQEAKEQEAKEQEAKEQEEAEAEEVELPEGEEGDRLFAQRCLASFISGLGGAEGKEEEKAEAENILRAVMDQRALFVGFEGLEDVEED